MAAIGGIEKEKCKLVGYFVMIKLLCYAFQLILK